MSNANQYIALLEKQITEIRNSLAEQRAVRISVATNDGTFGAEECCRVTGTGDPAAGTYTIYETVGGATVVEGRDPENAPGRRRSNASAKRDLAEARSQLKADSEAAKDRIAEIEREIADTRRLGMLTTQQAAIVSR